MGCPRLLVLLAQHLLLVAWALADNFAVIVSSSRYWHNYRHESNALSVYTEVKRLGIPDRNIILMVVDPAACNPRNAHAGSIFCDLGPQRNSMYTPSAQIDYRGLEVNVESLLGVLTGRHPEHTPASRRLASGPASTVLLYLTGHGGDEFLKLHDNEELLAADLGNAITQMHAAGRYEELLVVVDTCQASTLFNKVTAPNVVGLATSKLGESSYAHLTDLGLGVPLADQFTFHMTTFLRSLGPGSNATLRQLADYAQTQGLSSTIVPWASRVGGRRLSQVRVMEFFSAATSGPKPYYSIGDMGASWEGWWIHSQLPMVEASEGSSSGGGGGMGNTGDQSQAHPVTDAGAAEQQDQQEVDVHASLSRSECSKFRGASLYSLLLGAPAALPSS